jgi:hypothetical protein
VAQLAEKKINKVNADRNFILFRTIRPSFFAVLKITFLDGFAKSPFCSLVVIPAKAGIQLFQDILEPGFRRGDDWRDFLRVHLSLGYAKKPFFSIFIDAKKLPPVLETHRRGDFPMFTDNFLQPKKSLC